MTIETVESQLSGVQLVAIGDRLFRLVPVSITVG
jgi:hypothetical protein